MGSVKTQFIFIADLPPPLQGNSIVSAWVAEYLRDNFEFVLEINTSTELGVSYFLRRLSRFVAAGIKVINSNCGSTVYLALSHGKTLYAQAMIVALCKWKKQRVIVHHHSFLPINKPNLLHNTICHRYLSREAEHVFLSKYMRDKYQHVWKPVGKCWVVTNHRVASIRTSSQEPKEQVKLGKNICFAGKMSAEKGFWECEYLTRVLLKQKVEMSAIFLGPSAEPKILQTIKKLARDFPNRFEYVEQYDELTLSRTLTETTFFLFPSQYMNEASPLVVLEAQALGNICITSDAGSLTTDVLPPGRAIAINEWRKSAFEIIERFSADLPQAKFVSEKIRTQSAEIALESDFQIRELFYL